MTISTHSGNAGLPSSLEDVCSGLRKWNATFKIKSWVSDMFPMSAAF